MNVSFILSFIFTLFLLSEFVEFFCKYLAVALFNCKPPSFVTVEIPSVSKLEKNISVAMVNSYTPLSTTRPLVPGMIAVGGLHIYPNKKLPQELQTFLDGAVDGAIFFSLGEKGLTQCNMSPKY